MIFAVLTDLSLRLVEASFILVDSDIFQCYNKCSEHILSCDPFGYPVICPVCLDGLEGLEGLLDD